MRISRHFILGLFVAAVMTQLCGCGGSSGSSSAPASTTTMTGSVFAAPVDGAAVTVKHSDGTVIAGPVKSGADGTYSIKIPTAVLANDLIISSSSGTFTDEATGLETPAGTLAAFVSGGSLTAAAVVHLDPSSTIIHDLVITHGKTITDAETTFSSVFGYTPALSVAPKNAPTSGSDEAERLAGLRAVAFSQLTKDMGLAPDKQFDLLAALAGDLADDGMLNGSAGTVNGSGIPADIQNRFEHALVSLLTNTAVNLTGLTTDKIGSLPFGKVVLTPTYRVEYMPVDMSGAKVGKTSFKIKITKLVDDTPASGKSISLVPLMHMPFTSHATPVGSITDNGDGSYSCTAYYLMASGPDMGYWELQVKIGGMGGETATFYPAVGMAMGDTDRDTLSATSANDVISSGMGTAKRNYYLFHDGLVGTTGFKLFIATKESMMSFPPVSVGTVLSGPTATTVTAMTVRVSTDADPDAGVKTWIDAIPGAGTGQWSVSGLSNLVSGQTGTIYVQLNVNNEWKTTNSFVSNATGTNTYATFTVTP
jgi:hypothetical protein